MELVAHAYKTRFTPGHFGSHSNIVVQHGSESIELESGAGSRDHLWVARSGDTYYVLSVNYGLPYVGLSVYDVANLRKEAPRRDVGEDDYIALGEASGCFFQESAAEEIRSDFYSLGWLEMIEALSDYV